MSSHWILVLAACTACAVACGAPSDRRARSAAEGPPAVSAGAAGDLAPAREMPGPLAEIPAAPAPGPALLEPAEHTTPSGGADALRDTARRSRETPRPRIILDAAGPDVGWAILGTAAVGEPLAPSREPESLAAEEETGSVLDAPVPAAFAE